MRKGVMAIAAALLIAAFIGGCGHKADTQTELTTVKLQAVTEQSGGNALRYTASVKPATQIPVAFKVGGYVRELRQVRGADGIMRPLQEGDRVTKGMLLARVQEADYQVKVSQAHSKLAEAKAGSSASKAQIEEARAGSKAAESQLNEVTAGRQAAEAQLAEANAGMDAAKSQLEEARAGKRAAQAQLDEALAGGKMAESQLAQAQAAKRQTAADFGRVSNLYALRSITKAEYDGMKTKDEIAAATVAGAKAQVKQTATKAEQAKAQIEVMETKIAQAQAQVDALRAKEAQAVAQVKGIEAKSNTATAAITAAQTREDQAKAQLAAAEARISGAKALVQEASIPLGDTALTSPLTGVVLRRDIEVGSLVGPGSLGFVIADMSTVKVAFGVSDKHVSELDTGILLTVTTEAIPGIEFDGTVTSISPIADPKSRVFQVEVSVPNPDDALRAGMIAAVEVPTAEVVGAMRVIPISAVIRPASGESDFAVFVAEGQGDQRKVHLRTVKLGEALGNQIAVTSGLELGDMVVASGANLLVDGQDVLVAP